MNGEDTIIKGCIAGKRKYQNQLFRNYAPSLLGICMRYSPDRDSAEEILQESFIKIFRNLESFRGEGSFEGWMKRVVVNTAVNYFKQQKRLRAREVQDAFDDGRMEQNHHEEMDDFDASDHEMVNVEEVMKIVQTLPVGYRMVMNLYVFEGYTHREVAEALDISENTSKSQLSKARQYIRKKLESMKTKTSAYNVYQGT